MEAAGKRTIRKCAALVLAVAVYFIVHEGAHLLYSAAVGGFERIRFLGAGMQVVMDQGRMSDRELGIACLLAPAASLTAAYLLVWFMPGFLKRKSAFLRAAAYYATLALLLTDPVYLSVVYPYVGGGDMNGINLLIPELPARIFFGIVLLVNLAIVLKHVIPAYRKAYEGHRDSETLGRAGGRTEG